MLIRAFLHSLTTTKTILDSSGPKTQLVSSNGFAIVTASDTFSSENTEKLPSDLIIMLHCSAIPTAKEAKRISEKQYAVESARIYASNGEEVPFLTPDSNPPAPPISPATLQKSLDEMLSQISSIRNTKDKVTAPE